MQEHLQNKDIKVILSETFSYLNYWRDQIDPQLNQFFQSELQNPFCGEDYGREVLGKIAELTLRGGKRQRVAFVAASTALLGEDLTNEQTKQSL